MGKARATRDKRARADHTSVLKLIEEKWNLPPLTRRDAAAESPLQALDLVAAAPAFLTPLDLPKPTLRWGSWTPLEPAGRRPGQRGAGRRLAGQEVEQ